MEKLLLTKTNCIFTCPFLIGTITINLVPNNATYMSDILTEKASITCIGNCTNPIKTAPANGNPVPCGKNFSKWITGKELNIKINDSSVLNQSASVMCLDCGVKICSKVSPGILSSGKSASFNTPFMISTVIHSVSNHEKIISDKISKLNEVNTVYDPNNNALPDNFSDSKKIEDKLDGKADIVVKDNLKTYHNSEEKHIDNYDYVMCDYKRCQYAEGCEYIKAECTIKEPSDIRKINTDKEIEFINENEPLMEQYNTSWRNQAHHLISRKAVFAKSPEIVKLANFYGYNIDCSENAIYLPSNMKSDEDEESFKFKDEKYKKATAYDVIKITKLQWHVGQHQYRINLDEFNSMKPEIRARIKCYNEVLNTEFKKRVVNVYCNLNRKCCKYDDPVNRIKNRKAQSFIEVMNRLSADVEKHLMKFKTDGDPQKWFPYFVSSETLRYAYSIPTSGKLIKIFDKNKKFELRLYRYTKYKKDENSIILNDKNSMECSYPEYDIESIIEFCENTKIFFIFDDECRFRLPFNADEVYYICKNEIKFNIISNGRIIDCVDDMESVERKLSIYACTSMINQKYDMPQAVIRERKRQCNL